MSYYLQRSYFFDVHPPFAKLLFALVGWLCGYDGSFLFTDIGDSYITNKVPFVALRSLPATMGALTVPVVFLIMQESGYSLAACLVATSLVLFDNAHVAQTRLILLDATLILSMALALLCYIRFYKHRHVPFTKSWYMWLLLTGIALSCVISTKYVGVFAFITIGAVVLIDLWNLLDIKKGLTIVQFGEHFLARAGMLIVVPYLIYLFWFFVHFTILNKSGVGDEFMSPAFQSTLSDNAITLQSRIIHYGDTITIKHKDTKAFLHSHPETYPLRYDDGRISSQGQQVTGYIHDDVNNYWIIKPGNLNMDDIPTDRPVKSGDIIKLHHVGTNTDLLTHDVASPYYPTNEEFTTVSTELSYGDRHNDTLFELQFTPLKGDADFKTKASFFKLIHVPTRVAMWTHNDKLLPTWAFKQQEVNGNKNPQESSNIWFADSIVGLKNEEERKPKLRSKKKESMSFFSKYIELQSSMFYHNNALTSFHPYASVPLQWPFLLRGISFWTQDATRQQIYLLGNALGWWLTTFSLAIVAGIFLADQIALRRGVDGISSSTRSRLYKSTGFFCIAWATHYYPFYLMGRQLFLHHYLPAHLAASLVTGGVFQFIASKKLYALEDTRMQNKRFAATETKEITTVWGWILAIIIIVMVIVNFLYFAPLTYGNVPLSIEEVTARQWLPTWDFHFTK